jgi:hypothetical protein
MIMGLAISWCTGGLIIIMCCLPTLNVVVMGGSRNDCRIFAAAGRSVSMQLWKVIVLDGGHQGKMPINKKVRKRKGLRWIMSTSSNSFPVIACKSDETQTSEYNARV